MYLRPEPLLKGAALREALIKKAAEVKAQTPKILAALDQFEKASAKRQGRSKILFQSR